MPSVSFGSLEYECRKAGRIMNNFIKPGHGLDAVIPEGILAQAKGLAIFTVLKAGFIFSGRAGLGLVVARLPDGSWSAPSAIFTAGMGVGGQIGAELTDFVMVLNTQEAVNTFMQKGSITLGGNISVAVGPIGRNAEASGTASMKTVAAVYSYSKTQGLFAGVSLEGSVIVARSDMNRKLYRRKVSGRELLNGTIPPPAEAAPLYRALDLKFHTSQGQYNYNNMPSSRDHYGYNNTASARDQYGYDDTASPRGYYGFNDMPSSRGQLDTHNTPDDHRMFNRAAIHGMATGGRGAVFADSLSNDSSRNRPALTYTQDEGVILPETAATCAAAPRARAKFNFAGEQDGDLTFHKGDIISITRKTNTQDDWWTGEIGVRKGIFPANFVELL